MSDSIEDRRQKALRGAETRMLVGGSWKRSPTSFTVVDPAAGQPIAEVHNATVQDGYSAITAAYESLTAWSKTAPRRRAEILRRTFELMILRAEEIALLIAIEGGKTLKEARAEVSYAAEFLRWFSEEAVRISGGLYSAPSGGNRVLILRQPIGVALFITPWNFPAAMATRKIGPALAAGCTVVLKPAKETPLTALLIGRLFQEAGLPDGVLNILPTTQSRALSAAMLADPRIRKLSVTGSTQTGKILLAQAAQQVIKCSMELGGNAPFIVFEDADIDTAIQSALVAKTRNGGQSCTAANRFYVHRKIIEEFGERFAGALGALKVGHGLDDQVDLGPVINSTERDRLEGLIASAVAAGAVAVTTQRSFANEGYFVEPTLLVQVRPDAPILREEIFGPVAPLVAFDDEDEVIAWANDTPMGLVGFVVTKDLGRAFRVSERLECGMIGVNRGIVSDPAAPFGGWKESGVGREGGEEGILEYLETKYIAATW
jgi:succinate-semialdehyde dehydrogenase / glutarate-semialdehyde dehydrogenase